jgi:hypothetical protein
MPSLPTAGGRAVEAPGPPPAGGLQARPLRSRRPEQCDVDGHSARAACGAYCWIVTTGGAFVASIVMNRGMSRAGGGTGFRVVRRRLEPSAEYEYCDAVL